MFQKLLILSIFVSLAHSCVDVCRGRSDNHFAVNPRGCAWYFRCNIGHEARSEGRCPVDFVFNYEKQLCDYKENVECEDERNFLKECPQNGVAVIQHPNVCSKYVVCIDGNEEDRECSNGFHFSPFDGKCVEPSKAECKLDREFCMSKNNESEIFTNFNVINSRACDQFYFCWRNEADDVIGAATFRCQSGLHVNPENFGCEAPETAGCDTSAHPSPLSNPGINVNFNCPSDGIFAHPDSCRFWFFCTGGQSNLFQCGLSTYFDDTLKRCAFGPCNS